MTDMQLLAMVVSIVFPVSMLLYSNSRITDTKEVLKAELNAGFARMSSEIQSLEAKLKIHELEHHHK